MSEIPSIQNDPQLQRNLISIPVRGEYPTTTPTDNRSDLRGSSEMRSMDMVKDTEIDQDNETPVVQERISAERVEGEPRQLQEGDVEMEIIELPIKGNFLEIPDRCETDRLETEMVGDNPTHTPAQTIESGVEMEGDNEPVNMKRGQNETEKDNVIEKWGKREGIKRNLRDLSRKSYEECEDDCDEFDQSKKYKHGINCLLAALNHDVIRPLRKTELQPISELAVSGGTVPSATNRAGTGIQGGEKAKGGSCNAQSVRNHRRGNPTKYL